MDPSINQETPIKLDAVAMTQNHVSSNKALLDGSTRVCIRSSGSGSFLLGDAIRAGADVFVTSDFKYHEFFDADGRIVIADVGHYESEWQTTDLILKRLNEKFPNFALHLAKANPNPIHYR